MGEEGKRGARVQDNQPNAQQRKARTQTSGVSEKNAFLSASSCRHNGNRQEHMLAIEERECVCVCPCLCVCVSVSTE